MLGRVRYIALYLLSAIGGGVLVYLVKGPGYSSVGASGAIFGLFAAYWVLARRVRADTSAITGTIVLNLIISVTFPGISLWGHVGGLITGALIGAVFAFAPSRRWHAAAGRGGRRRGDPGGRDAGQNRFADLSASFQRASTIGGDLVGIGAELSARTGRSGCRRTGRSPASVRTTASGVPAGPGRRRR